MRRWCWDYRGPDGEDPAPVNVTMSGLREQLEAGVRGWRVLLAGETTWKRSTEVLRPCRPPPMRSKDWARR
jgi:hypothetical protein